MSFGFSLGDFLAAIELVGTVIQSLRDSGGAKASFGELVHELTSLETALLRVQQLDLGDEQKGDYAAITQVASQCQFTIERFWSKVSQFQDPLLYDSRSVITAAWMKVRWTLCKKEDLAKFKADIAAHTQSILLLLVAVQMVSERLRGLVFHLADEDTETRADTCESKPKTAYHARRHGPRGSSALHQSTCRHV